MNAKKKFLTIFLTLISVVLAVFLSACGSEPVRYQYGQPEDLADSISVGTIEEAGIDVEVLGRGIDRIRDGDFKAIHSLLIYKDGKLVVEEYFGGHPFSWEHAGYKGPWIEWTADRHHVNMSVTKTYVSAIVSIAISKGYIDSVHDSIFDYLPDYQRFAIDGKENITIEHLLTMTSGLEFNEWNSKSSGKNSIMNIYDCPDAVVCVLEVPLIHKPGTSFTYSGGNFIVLGEIIKYATGMEMDEFASIHLFKPLGIDELPQWVRYDLSGMVDAAGGLLQTPREMLKLGVTYLNNGVWDGQQIIDPEWVAKSAVPYGNNTRIKIPGDDAGRKGYGYSWWTFSIKHNGETYDAYNAGGWGGQRIIVLPGLDMVVVFTAGNYNSTVTNHTILEKHIIAALLSE
jgi:CubicO group peptidase (beta-lactamase class C family)